MKQLTIIFLFCFFSFNQINGQDSVLNHPIVYPNNSIFIEIAGNSFFFGSLNYERVFFNKNFFYLTGRIGIGYGKMFGTSILSIPILFNGIFKLYRALAFEAGIGVTLMRIGQNEEMGSKIWSYENTSTLNAVAGFRVQDKKGFLFRVDFTPFYFIKDANSLTIDEVVQPYFGISFGYSFGKQKK